MTEVSQRITYVSELMATSRAPAQAVQHRSEQTEVTSSIAAAFNATCLLIDPRGEATTSMACESCLPLTIEAGASDVTWKRRSTPKPRAFTETDMLSPRFPMPHLLLAACGKRTSR